MVELFSVEFFILLFASALVLMAGFYVNIKGHEYYDIKLRWTGIGLAFIGIVGELALVIPAIADLYSRI